MFLIVRLDSCKRIELITSGKNSKIDKVALLRECESPRQEIEKKIYWVCFEAEMKLQIWISQYQTYHTLMQNGETGISSQLNMGEGKTQTIIPMITLQLIFGNSQKSKTPRVNLLNSLLSESRANYFKYLSATAFNIPIVELPFDRSVDFQDSFISQKIELSLRHFGSKMMFLLDQSSTHSLILKLREISIKKKDLDTNKQRIVFQGFDCFDIFDEVDAQMHPKKSFIYSIGSASELDEAQYRSDVSIIFLEALCYCIPKLY